MILKWLDKFKLQTQLTTLHIIDEKQVAIEDTIKIISSLNASQQMLVSEVLKLVKLILLVPASNAVSERSSSTLRRAKSYLRSSMTQERLKFCLILATYKKLVDKLNLVEVANQFCFSNEHQWIKISLEIWRKVQLWGPKHRTKVVDQ